MRVCAVWHILTGRAVQYIYNAEGQRVAKGNISSWSCNMQMNGFVQTNSYVLGPAGEQVTELDGNGNWLHTNVFAAGQLVATYENSAPAGQLPSPGLHFHLTDWLGSKRIQLSAAGQVEQQCQNLPFGDGQNCSGSAPDATEHHFTGKERDAESGLDYFGARYYASNMGRWMSPDWAAKAEPVPYAKLDNPQSLNLYGYVGNNPLSKSDPDGHDFAEAWKHFKNVIAQTTVKVTVGFGAGGKINAGSTQARAEAAIKANVKFSNGKITATTSIEGGVSAGAGGKKVGFAGSGEKVAASVDLNNGQAKAGGETSSEYVVGTKTGGTSMEQSKEGFSVNGEEGEGLLGGGGISLTKEGVSEFKEGVQELKNTLFPGAPPPPPSPGPPQMQ